MPKAYDVLRSKAHQNQSLDTSVRRDSWLRALHTLYDQIERWLERSVREGLVEVLPDDELQLYEPMLGRYSAPAKSFRISNQVLRIRPKGTYIFGTNGRVDVEGSAGSEMLILFKDFEHWFHVGDSPDDIRPLTEDEFGLIMEEVVA